MLKHIDNITRYRIVVSRAEHRRIDHRRRVVIRDASGISCEPLPAIVSSKTRRVTIDRTSASDRPVRNHVNTNR